MKEKYLSQWLFLLCLAALLLLPSTVFATEQTVEADGYYTVGDGAEENFSVARERAKQDALGRAAEQAAVYVEKLTAVKNHQLTTSEIKTLASKVLKVMDAVFENTVEGNVFKIRCHVVAVVGDDGLDSLMADRKELIDSLHREREKDEQIAALNREMEELKRTYQAAATNAQRSEIREKVQANDTSFTAAQLVGEGIHKMDWRHGNRDYKGAIACFEEAIALQPDYAFAYYNLGIAYEHMFGYGKAIEYFNKAIELCPSYAEAYYKLGNIYLLSTDVSVRRDDKALECLRKAIDLKSDYAVAYYHLGRIYLKKHEYSKAIECWNKVVKLSADDSINYHLMYNLLGYAYIQTGEYQKVIECCDKAIALKSDYADAYYNRGVAYERLGNRKAAKRDYAKAYEINPRNKMIQSRKEQSENW